MPNSYNSGAQLSPRPTDKTHSSFKIWLFAGAALLGGVILIFTLATYTPGPDFEGDFSDVSKITEDDWVRGNPDATVTLIEYSDFQCPACEYFADITEKLVNEFGGHIAFVYRHLPLITIHQAAVPAARAAEAAGLQGKFWEMHDKLFSHQSAWSKSDDFDKDFLAYAEELGLDPDQFVTDYNSAEVRAKVDAALASAQDLGLNSTPSFFLNGQRLSPNPRGYEAFRQIIREALGQSS